MTLSHNRLAVEITTAVKIDKNMWNNNLQLQNNIGLREGTAYTSLTVLIEASQTQNCRRMRRESRPQSPACLMYLAWPVEFDQFSLYSTSTIFFFFSYACHLP